MIKPTLQKPVRTSVTACRYGLDGKLIAAGLHDGSIQLWSVSGVEGEAGVGGMSGCGARYVGGRGSCGACRVWRGQV